MVSLPSLEGTPLPMLTSDRPFRSGFSYLWGKMEFIEYVKFFTIGTKILFSFVLVVKG